MRLPGAQPRGLASARSFYPNSTTSKLPTLMNTTRFFDNQQTRSIYCPRSSEDTSMTWPYFLCGDPQRVAYSQSVVSFASVNPYGWRSFFTCQRRAMLRAWAAMDAESQRREWFPCSSAAPAAVSLLQPASVISASAFSASAFSATTASRGSANQCARRADP
jgi:hypothetical protein